MAAGHNKKLATIYLSPPVLSESREVLAETRNSNVTANGSVTSIPVMREQYCLCTPTTRLEKRLVVLVLTLVIVIVVLLVGVSILADRERDRNGLKTFMQTFTTKI